MQKSLLCVSLLSVFVSYTWADGMPGSSEEVVSKAAFSQLLKQDFPLTPSEIQKFKAVAAEQQKANSLAPQGSPIQSNSQIISISMKPGGPQEVVRIGQGTITSLIFTDQNGQVWPITSYSVGDPTSFNVQWNKSSGVLMVQGQKLYADSNIAVMLKGLDVPVMVNLMLGQKKWDYMDYLRVEALAPGDNTVEPSQLAGAPAYLMDILNGVPPMGSVPMQTDNSGVQVWGYQGYYLVLTQGTLMSPAWKAKANGPGADPYHAYEITPTPVLLVSDQGNLVRVMVTGGSTS